MASLPRASKFFEDAQEERGGFRTYGHPYACRHHYHDSGRPQQPQAPAARVPSAPREVLLHVYELTAFEQVNRVMATELFPIGGALHVGVEVYGREWSFGGGDGPGAGVHCEVPRSNSSYRFRETLPLGGTPLTETQVTLVIGDMLEVWHPKDYHWLHRNCLAFANELCRRLQVGRIPAWIDRFARGASVIDLGMRGLAGGLMESVQGAAVGARDLLLAVVEGRSCTSCAPTARSAVCTLSSDGPGTAWHSRVCSCKAWNPPPAAQHGLCGGGPRPPRCASPSCASPPWRNFFEVVNDPDERIAYRHGGDNDSETGEVPLPAAVEPSGEDWLRCEESTLESEVHMVSAAAAQAPRLDKWFQGEATWRADLATAVEANKPPPPPPVGRKPSATPRAPGNGAPGRSQPCPRDLIAAAATPARAGARRRTQRAAV